MLGRMTQSFVRILKIFVMSGVVFVVMAGAGQHLDIELVDHLMIGNQRFVSLKERLRW